VACFEKMSASLTRSLDVSGVWSLWDFKGVDRSDMVPIGRTRLRHGTVAVEYDRTQISEARDADFLMGNCSYPGTDRLSHVLCCYSVPCLWAMINPMGVALCLEEKDSGSREVSKRTSTWTDREFAEYKFGDSFPHRPRVNTGALLPKPEEVFSTRDRL
jgi:hypothetical protein